MTLKLIIVMAIGFAPLTTRGAEKDWTPLFDGKSLSGWVNERGGEPGKGWTAADGVLHHRKDGGNIFTDRKFRDFEFSFEWKVSKGANSGVKYRLGHGSRGPEFQVLDDANHPRGSEAKTSAGALYELFAPDPAAKLLKPVGEWNTSRIVAKGTHFEHWLNGQKVVSVDTDSPEWKQAVADSKFAGEKDFGAAAEGRLMLQDHGDEVWFRNLRIREL